MGAVRCGRLPLGHGWRSLNVCSVRDGEGHLLQRALCRAELCPHTAIATFRLWLSHYPNRATAKSELGWGHAGLLKPL